MIVAEHLCGIAIAYPGGKKVSLKNGNQGDDDVPPPVIPAGGVFSDRPQGSLINYQKRQIANAVHWIANFPFHKRDKFGLGPMVFVCTTSPNWGCGIFEPKISKFVHTLRNGYGAKNFVWVREFTESGCPHYHFVIDIPAIKSPVGLSRYWSGLFGAVSVNAVRLGSKPDKRGKRTFRITKGKAARMAGYISEYLKKQMAGGPEYEAAVRLYRSMGGGGDLLKSSLTIPGRKFAISNEAARFSAPVIYRPEYEYVTTGEMVMNAAGQMVERPAAARYQLVNQVGETFNKSNYTWKQVKDYPVYFGKKILKSGF